MLDKAWGRFWRKWNASVRDSAAGVEAWNVNREVRFDETRLDGRVFFYEEMIAQRWTDVAAEMKYDDMTLIFYKKVK